MVLLFGLIGLRKKSNMDLMTGVVTIISIIAMVVVLYIVIVKS